MSYTLTRDYQCIS